MTTQFMWQIMLIISRWSRSIIIIKLLIAILSLSNQSFYSNRWQFIICRCDYILEIVSAHVWVVGVPELESIGNEIISFLKDVLIKLLI